MKFIKIIVLLSLTACSLSGFAQKTKVVKLKATVSNLSLKNCCIAQVVDDRADTSNIGTMRAGITNKTAFVALPNGTKGSVASFIKENVTQHFKNDSISVHITALEVSESSSSMKERATLTFAYAFYKNETKITDYKGSNYIETGMDASPYIGKMVSQSIESAVQAFDDYWKENKNHYTAQGELKVTCKVNILQQNVNQNYIIFQPSIRLNIADFQGTPDDLSAGAAGTYSGILFSMKTLTDENGITANVYLTPIFDKLKSWMKPQGRITSVLEHEELHFKISALRMYELASQIQKSTWNAKTLSEDLQLMFDNANTTLDQWQRQYDAETKHGTNKVAQKMWNEKINKALEEKMNLIN